MQALIPLLLVFILAGPVWAEEPAEPPDTVGAKTTLNAGAHYLDKVFAHALSSLELVASTPEAMRGDWKGIKPYLQKLKQDLPGIYYYVQPDGNYYSVAMDYTNLNLKNRPYFQSLFAGKPVMGFPIYSRSSGEKSATVAVPIMVNDKVTGALGISIFLEELAKELNQVIAIPRNYTWFALNAEATDMLDSDSDFIFMNPLKQGGPSMREAIPKALARNSGEIE